MKRKSRILVAIPSYNCAAQIARVLRAFDDRLLSRVDEIMVIDNRSSDGTVEAAIEAIKTTPLLASCPKIKVVRNRRNYNLGGSFKLAWLHAVHHHFDSLVFLHGDAQAETREMHRFLDEEQADSGATAAFLGARFLPESKLVNYSKARELGNRALNLVFSAATLKPIHDIGSGLNLYRIPAVDLDSILALPDDPAFDTDLLLNYLGRRAHLKFVPITWLEEDQVSNVGNVSITLTVLARLARWRFKLPRESARSLESELSYDQHWPPATNRLQIVMPMGGIGRRFRDKGFTTPKPLIEVEGQPMFARSIASLAGLGAPRKIVAIVREQDDAEHDFSQSLRRAVPAVEIVRLDRDTKGPVETCLKARDELEPELPLVVLDSDFSFESAAYEQLVKELSENAARAEGVVLFHTSSDPRFSYAETREGYVTRTAEKDAISDQALIGAYFFSKASLFFEAADRLLSAPPSARLGEYYVSQLYNILITERKARIAAVPADLYLSFGTPEELEASLPLLRRRNGE